MTTAIDQIPAIQVLGIRVHMAEIPDVINVMDDWIQSDRQRFHYVVNTGMHGLMEGHRDPEFRNILDSADLFAPDGILVLLVARLRGFALRKRETGPELLWRFSETAAERNYKYFFYGDVQETLKQVSEKILGAYPGVEIVGVHSPPFRPLTAEEDQQVINAINQAAPDVLWVGLGAPKQERWIFEHRDKLNVPVVIGIGASFKFLAGTVKRAPSWVRNGGFEWLWRFLQEPGRVWRRVFIDAPQFVGLAALEMTGLKKYG